MPKNKSSKSKHSKSITASEAKSIRKNLAKLKRKGLYGGQVRGKKITAASKKLVERFRSVLQGFARVFKPKKKDREKLKAQGVQFTRGRAVLSKNVTARNGQLFIKGSKRGKGKLRTLNPQLSLDEAVREAFENIPHPNGLAFILFGNQSHRVYFNPDELITDLKFGYQIKPEDMLAHIRFYANTVPPERYEAKRQREIEANRLATKNRARQRQRANRAARRRGKA